MKGNKKKFYIERIALMSSHSNMSNLFVCRFFDSEIFFFFLRQQSVDNNEELLARFGNVRSNTYYFVLSPKKKKENKNKTRKKKKRVFVKQEGYITYTTFFCNRE